MGKYVEFSEEQIRTANNIDLSDFLMKQGERLEKSGKEMRWLRNTSVTIKGNRWFQHKYQDGGYPIKFLKKFYNCSFPDAVQLLLNEAGDGYKQYHPSNEEKKEFHPPLKSPTMKRVYGYLIKERCISSKIIQEFTDKGLIYESEKFHNVVFAGIDENGEIRHAHKKSTFTKGESYRGNETGSDPRFSFHWNGVNDNIYVFEAPIDMLSYISLHPDEWQKNHYVALNGVSIQPLLYQLEKSPNINQINLCLDHDIAGDEAVSRIKEELFEHGYFGMIDIKRAVNKDWNEDLKEIKGNASVQQCVDNPKQKMFCYFVDKYKHEFKSKNNEVVIRDVMDQYMAFFSVLNKKDPIQEVRKCLLMLSNYAMQMQGKLSNEEMISIMKSGYYPHKDRGNLSKRIETLKNSINQLKQTYVNKNLNQRQIVLQRNLLDVADDSMMILAYLDIQEELENLKQEEMNMNQKVKPKCPLIGTDGNVFSLIGMTGKSLKAICREDLALEMQKRVMNSQSYDEALQIMDEYVEVTSISEFGEQVFVKLDNLKFDLEQSGFKDEIEKVSIDVMTSDDTEDALEKIDSYRQDHFPQMSMGH